MSDKTTLFNNLLQCDFCPARYQKTPFCFPMKDQKVMLLTACPSVQAMHRPLTSVRFFRTICVALFGDAGISPEYIPAIHEKIYWTHYQKCYQKNILSGNHFEDLTPACYERWFHVELDTLRPEVIIVFGAALGKLLFEAELSKNGFAADDLKEKCVEIKKWGRKVLVTDFPSTGAEPRFDVIRDLLAQRNEFRGLMKRNDDGKWISDRIIHTQLQTHNLSTHIEYEYRQLMHNLSGNSLDDQLIDHVWYRKVIEPNNRNCEKVAQMAFFVEEQIRTLLADVVADGKLTGAFHEEKIKALNSCQIRAKDPIQAITDLWTDHFCDLLTHFMKTGFILQFGERLLKSPKDIHDLHLRLTELKRLRNCIVHAGGYLEPSARSGSSSVNFSGIYYDVNMLCIDASGVKSVKRFTDDIVGLLEEYDRLKLPI